MPIIFSDKNIDIAKLYPFSLMRKIEEIRVGIFTIKEKWERSFQQYGLQQNYIVCANLLPTQPLLNIIKALKPGQAICDGNEKTLVQHASNLKISEKILVNDALQIEFPWHIFQYNAETISNDFELVKSVKPHHKGSASIFIDNPDQVIIEEGAIVKHAIINADEGPVYIESGAIIMEGSMLRGPLYIGKGAVVKMGTKIYGATTIGPGCVVGGEIKNSVLFGYSNKAHDGYLGDSVIAEWCNLGGGTTNSNLKNTAGNITIQLQDKNYTAGKKCGVLMGDFSKTAINTSLNTGTVIGVCANVFGHGLTPKHIPSFSWGYDDSTIYRLNKAIADITEWKKFKNETLTESEINNLTIIYNSKNKN